MAGVASSRISRSKTSVIPSACSRYEIYYLKSQSFLIYSVPILFIDVNFFVNWNIISQPLCKPLLIFFYRCKHRILKSHRIINNYKPNNQMQRPLSFSNTLTGDRCILVFIFKNIIRIRKNKREIFSILFIEIFSPPLFNMSNTFRRNDHFICADML